MQFIAPIVLLAVSILGIFVAGKPMYADIQTLTADRGQYKEAIEKGKEFDTRVAALKTQRETISPDEIARLGRMLPPSVDTVHLVVEINKLAQKHSTGIKNVQIIDAAINAQAGNKKSYDSVTMTFGLSAPYERFVAFLKEMELNLRLVDVTAVTFTANDTSPIYDYVVTVQTHWLNSQ